MIADQQWLQKNQLSPLLCWISSSNWDVLVPQWSQVQGLCDQPHLPTLRFQPKRLFRVTHLTRFWSRAQKVHWQVVCIASSSSFYRLHTNAASKCKAQHFDILVNSFVHEGRPSILKACYLYTRHSRFNHHFGLVWKSNDNLLWTIHGTSLAGSSSAFAQLCEFSSCWTLLPFSCRL